jgi:hypothetical protein
MNPKAIGEISEALVLARLICVYCPDNDKVYKIPIAVCGPRSKNLSLTKERTRVGCELATEYEI